MLTDDDRKQERVRHCLRSMIHSNRKTQRPARKRQILPKKAEGRPGIRTQPARTEICCSTACATTAALTTRMIERDRDRETHKRE